MPGKDKGPFEQDLFWILKMQCFSGLRYILNFTRPYEGEGLGGGVVLEGAE